MSASMGGVWQPTKDYTITGLFTFTTPPVVTTSGTLVTTTATYAAYIGASMTLQADNGLWNVVAAVGVTIT